MFIEKECCVDITVTAKVPLPGRAAASYCGD
ncbi:hypothetical protein CEXT_20441, partial [Caerostris extrusa]